MKKAAGERGGVPLSYPWGQLCAVLGPPWARRRRRLVLLDLILQKLDVFNHLDQTEEPRASRRGEIPRRTEIGYRSVPKMEGTSRRREALSLF